MGSGLVVELEVIDGPREWPATARNGHRLNRTDDHLRAAQRLTGLGDRQATRKA